ncbi:MAG TPA: hemin uptake protein HemP [Kaistia sp.]|nr:hemin uptake protein HemP [Kaistia sp.]
MQEQSGTNGEADAARPQPRIVSSESLLQGAREVIIRHGSEDYRLRLTRVGKLILNK